MTQLIKDTDIAITPHDDLVYLQDSELASRLKSVYQALEDPTIVNDDNLVALQTELCYLQREASARQIRSKAAEIYDKNNK